MTHLLFATQLLFIGSTELLLIGGIALLLFGGKKLPEMMRGLGQGVREFKKGVNDTKETDENPNEEVEKKGVRRKSIKRWIEKWRKKMILI